MLCTPIDGGTCSCEFSTDLMADDLVKGHCVRTAGSYVMFCLYTIIAIIGLFALIDSVRKLLKTRRSIVGLDTLVTTSIMSTLTAFAYVVHESCRAATALTEGDDFVPALSVLIISQAVVTFLAVVANVFFGVSLVFIMVNASKLVRTDPARIRRVSMISGLAGGAAIIVVLIPLIVVRQYALASAAVAIWFVCTWVLFGVATSKMDFATSGDSSSRAIAVLKLSAKVMRVTSFVFAIAALLYVIFWYAGKHLRSRVLLGPLCAAAMWVMNTAVLVLVYVLTRVTAGAIARRSTHVDHSAQPRPSLTTFHGKEVSMVTMAKKAHDIPPVTELGMSPVAADKTDLEAPSTTPKITE